jgi:1,4-alpha-glucan branching enzyme
MKWNMGWMHDTLAYLQMDPIYRRFHHDQLTFGHVYAFSENFVLPLSHDEVVHGKRSLLDKMPGDVWRKFANLRLLLSYQATFPGKKLNFMGVEMGQWLEWNPARGLDWELLDFDSHRGIQHLLRDLNRLYVAEAPLHDQDFDAGGFSWVDSHDADQSVISFLRHARDGRFVLVALNFTPVPRHGYRLGVPRAGDYAEVFNSDSGYYGGSNIGNGDGIKASAESWMGRPASIEITLPPLAAVVVAPR